MADSPTKEGYGELGKLAAIEPATGFKSIACVSACTADEDQTYANCNRFTTLGLGIQDADTVETVTTTVANDTVHINHMFTSSGTATVKGFVVCNDDDDVVLAISCFAADRDMEIGDTLECDMTGQFKKGT